MQMAFDGLFTRKIVEDIQSLVTGRIHKITEPSNDTIILTIRSERKINNYYYQHMQISVVFT